MGRARFGRGLVLLAAWLLSPGSLAGEPFASERSLSSQQPDSDPAVETFREETTRVMGRIELLRRQLANDLKRLESTREDSRRRERASEQSPAGKGRTRALRYWKRTAQQRATVQSRVEQILVEWHGALDRIVPSEKRPGPPRAQREEIAQLCVSVLGEWASVGEPGAILASIRDEHGGLRAALGWLESTQVRRDFLHVVADRTAATTGRSDVDVLVAIVEWEALFLANAEPGRVAFDVLTEDLILLFTDRGSDALSLSGSTHYRPSRCRDIGFKAALRDGSDQVRHVCWAFRMYSISESLDDAERTLRFKELGDAVRRGLPLNEADLSLNRAAREIVDEILADFPSLREADVRAVIAFAASSTEEDIPISGAPGLHAHQD